MAGIRIRGEKIRQFIIDHVAAYPASIVALVSDKFGISRQAVNNHIKYLINQNTLVAEGKTRSRIYRLHPEIIFDKTVVPVSMARYGNELLVSRSQAKRLLAHVDRFKIVIFDFSGIDQIGQAFADEVFRVFKNKHPEMQLYFSQATREVEDMIIRALGAGVGLRYKGH